MKILSESTFKTLAGDGAYQRGYAYYSEGRVGPLSISNSRITAEVAGTQQYSVVLHHTAKLFEGHCTCPASDNFDFCKHCVAVSLSYYYQTQTNQELPDRSSKNQVLDYLHTLTKPQLAEELHKLLLQDKTVMDLWQLKADIARGGLTPKEIRKRITKAIPYKPNGLWRYRDVAEYFDASALALSVLQDPIYVLNPSDAIKLIVYAAQRLNKTLQTIDDSGGYRFQVEQQLQNWFDQTILSEQWSDTGRAQVIIKLLTDQELDYSALQPTSIFDRVNQKTLDLVYTSLNKEFEGLPPQADQYADQYYYYIRIENLLLEQARQQNDIEKEFLILEKGAVTVPKCLDLVALCIHHKRLEEANKWLTHAGEITAVSGYQTYNIESTQIELLKAEGQTQKALELQWSRFEEQEDFETLRPALTTAKDLNQEDEYLARAISMISDKLTPDRHNPKNQRRAGNLVDIHLEYGDVKSAYDLSDRYLINVEYLSEIVAATEEFSEKTYALIERIVNQLVLSATNSAYDHAVTFLKRQEQRLPSANKLRLYKSIKNIYDVPKNKRKTNLVKRLKKAFPSAF